MSYSIYHKRFRTLAFCVALYAVTAYAESAVADTTAEFFLPSGVQVRIVEASFNKSRSKVYGCSERDVICRINGRVPFGSAFGLPKTFVKSIRVTYKGKSHALDVSDMYNAWGERPLEYPGVIRYFGGNCFDPNNCQLRGLFSDGAGSFVAEGRVTNGTSVRTTLTDSNDVVNLFKKNIDPPEFD
jgi:hypothetical protein